MTGLDELGAIREVLAACHDDPALFQRAVLGRDLWSKQEQVCAAVARSPITVVPAGRAVGKSFLLAGIVLWWLYTRRSSLVITTGPDHRQVVSVLWKEIRRALRPRYEGGRRVAPRIDLGHDHLTEGYGSPQRLTVAHGSEWGALGFATKSEEGLSGQHAGELLVIVDEASGVSGPAWAAIHGLAAARVVVVGNPIRYDCHFRELHDLAEKGSENIATVPISSLEHPHATREHSPIGAVCRSFLGQMREIHGEDSPWWRSNILGLFPGAESVQFIPSAWLDACARESTRDDELWQDLPPGPAVMGVDVGGGVGADRSVVLIRNRKQLLEVFASEWHGVLDDARHRLEPVVLAMADRWKVTPDRLVYDKGGPGRSFASYLSHWRERQRAEWLDSQPGPQPPHVGPQPFGPAVGYFGAGRGGRLYVNRRTANGFAIRRRLDPHREGYVPFYCGGIPEWPELRRELAELRSPTMEVEEGCVKQVLEDKESLAARLHRSPDLLDALLMSFTFSE